MGFCAQIQGKGGPRRQRTFLSLCDLEHWDAYEKKISPKS